MIRPVLHFPERRLKTPAVALPLVGAAARRLAADLRDTAAAHPGTVGLAAPQIGVMWRMIHVDQAGHPKGDPAVAAAAYVNPVVVEAEGAGVGREGCLSLPDVTANVRRAERITMRALNLDGAPVEVRAEGFHARVLLHEIDHLDGVLILDRVASLARDVFPRLGGGRGQGVSRAEARVVRARTLARVAHAGQRYGDAGPYTRHLEDVVGVLSEFGVADPGLRAAAWLHDAVEDTPVAVDDLVPDFGRRVADLVDALTVYPGPDGEPDHEDSWRRIAATPGAVAVKLADRVANVRHGGPRVGKYRRQQAAFRALLAGADRGECPPDAIARMWDALDAALERA